MLQQIVPKRNKFRANAGVWAVTVPDENRIADLDWKSISPKCSAVPSIVREGVVNIHSKPLHGNRH